MPDERVLPSALEAMSQAGIVVNLMFMFLNLLPILPLDGGRIVASLLPHPRRVALRQARALGHPAPSSCCSSPTGSASCSSRSSAPPTRSIRAIGVLTMYETRVLSGMRPTGSLHLGHYHGALKNWVRLQDEYECLFFVADWHALTTDYEKPGDVQAERLGDGDRLARRRPRPEPGDALHPVAGARARRAAPAALDDHAARLARARADLQGPAGEARGQGPRDLRLPRLSAAAGGRHPDLPRDATCRWARTRCRTSRSRARSRAASITSTAASRASRRRPRPR